MNQIHLFFFEFVFQMCFFLFSLLFLFCFFLLKNNTISLLLFVFSLFLLFGKTEFLSQIFKRDHVHSVMQTTRHVVEENQETKESDFVH